MAKQRVQGCICREVEDAFVVVVVAAAAALLLLLAAVPLSGFEDSGERHACATGKASSSTARTLRQGRKEPLHGTRRGMVASKGAVACLCECDAVM